MNIEFDTEGKISENWIAENIKKDDWIAGYAAFDLGQASLFITRDRKFAFCNFKIVKKNKCCWTVDTKDDKLLFVGMKEDEIRLMPEHCLDFVEKIYYNPLELKNYLVEELFEIADHNYESLAFLLDNIILVGAQSYKEQALQLDDTKIQLMKELDNLKSRPMNLYTYIQFGKLKTKSEDYNKKQKSLKEDSEKFIDMTNSIYKEFIQFLDEEIEDERSEQPKYLS